VLGVPPLDIHHAWNLESTQVWPSSFFTESRILPSRRPDQDAENLPDHLPEPAAIKPPHEQNLVRQFVEHWGGMARSWGINATMGELFALLYITGESWTAEDLRERLHVSRGNVSMNLRELITWGIVHKVHRQGERREYYRAEFDVLTLFKKIFQERKRRELDPTLVVLERSVAIVGADPAHQSMRGRIEDLQQFFALINTLSNRILALEPEDLDDLRKLLEALSPPDFLEGPAKQ
jgi:DNA-binding transcriptional regulator GbsR (MarR family)